MLNEMLLNFANFSSGAEWKGSGLSWSESSTVFFSHIWSCHQQLEALDDCLFQLVQPQWVGERSCELLSSEPLWCWHCRQRKGQQHHSIESPLITVTVWTVSASVARVPLAVGICSSMAGPLAFTDLLCAHISPRRLISTGTASPSLSSPSPLLC